MRAINLRTEHMANPMGIDIKNPYLSWNCTDGKIQSAYEITATDAYTGKELWGSGKVSSASMHTICPIAAFSRQRVSWKIRLWDENDIAGEWSEQAFFEMGLLEISNWTAKWINPEIKSDDGANNNETHNKEAHQPASYLRTVFDCDKDSLNKNARLYVTAHGLYETWINGKRVGDFVLAPGSYNYDKRLAYQTYDVSDFLREGKNDIQVILGDGWYRSVSGVDGDRNIYGEDIALLFQLEVDGQAVCVSDDKWEASQNGAIRENDMQQGEIVDARLTELSDWHEVKVEDFSYDNLICSDCLPVCEMERFNGKIITTPNGETVIDFGQNLAGYVEFTINAHDGDTIVLTHGETLDENGNFTQENFQDRKRHKEGGTRQQLVYICAEGENHYKTKFSIWGFRYAKLETAIDLSDAVFTAIAVYSEMETLTSFKCGNSDVNQLVQNSIWSQKSNFCDVPTDCPTRERAAWTGDMGVFAHTGLYLMDAYPVMRKWLAECRAAQFDDGKIANIAPRNNNPSFFSGLLAGSVGWGDACIIVPYEMYKRNGDVRILAENYEMMKKWYAFLESRARKSPMNPVKRFKRNPYRKYTIETGIDYGEWCEPDVESTSAMRTPQGKVATAFFAHSGQMLAEIASILGKKEDALHYNKTAELAQKAWRFIATEDGRIISDRQADYVRALAFGLLEGDEAKQAAKDLDELVKKCGCHLNTGFLSTPNLTRVLCDNGYVATAYKLLLQDTRPSWLYEVKKGATTIWETWDGINEKGEVKASLNHYSYGAICGWIIDSVCGIRFSDKKVKICPHPDKALGYARAEYQSPWGKVVSGWKYDGDEISYEIEIPSNTRAEVVLPDGRRQVLEAGSYKF